MGDGNDEHSESYNMKRRLLIINAVWIPLFFILLFSPKAATMYWHITEENPIHYEGWDIRVPSDWRAGSYGSSLTLDKSARIPWYTLRPDVMISSSLGRPFDKEEWLAFWVHGLKRYGYHNLIEMTLPTASAEVVCLKGAESDTPSQFKIVCTTMDEKLHIEYHGEEKDIPAFKTIILGIEERSP